MRTILPKDAHLVPEHAVCVFKGQIFDTYQWEEKMFDGTTAIFEMLKRPDSVEVLVVHENKILVQKQEQPHYGHFIGFPGGRHDHEEETELEAVQRELKEESGYICRDWKLIRVEQTQPKIEGFLYTYIATGVIDQVPMALDPGERIENVWCTLAEVKEYVAKGLRSHHHVSFDTLTHADELLALPPYEG